MGTFGIECSECSQATTQTGSKARRNKTRQTALADGQTGRRADRHTPSVSSPAASTCLLLPLLSRMMEHGKQARTLALPHRKPVINTGGRKIDFV